MNTNDKTGITFIQSIKKDIGIAWKRLDTDRIEEIEKTEREAAYLRIICSSVEYLLHLVPTVFTLIAVEKNPEKQDEIIRKYIEKKNSIKGNRNFLEDLLKEFQEIAEKSGEANSSLDLLKDKIKENMRILKDFRNIDVHGSVQINRNKIENIYKKKYQNETVLKKPSITINEILEEITNFIENYSIQILNPSRFNATDSTGIDVHCNGLLCLEDAEDRLFTYMETSLVDGKKKKDQKFQNEYWHHMCEDRIKLKDKNDFSENISLYAGIKNSELWKLTETNSLVLGVERKNPIVEIIQNDKSGSKPYFYTCKIVKINEDQPDIEPTVIFKTASVRINDDLKANSYFEKEIEIAEKITEEGLYNVEVKILIGTETSENTESIIKFDIRTEKKDEGKFEIQSILSTKEPFQNQPFEIKVILQYTGNIQRTMGLEMILKDKEYFHIAAMQEINPKNNPQNMEMENDEEFESDLRKPRESCKKQLSFERGETKYINIIIVPVRSENGIYRLGEILLKDEKNGESERVELSEYIKTKKSFQPINFYNRVLLLKKLNDSITGNKNKLVMGIEKVWIKGEGGQGKTRLAQEISRLVEKNHNTCITVSFDKNHNKTNRDILKQLYKAIRKELIKHGKTPLEIPERDEMIEGRLNALGQQGHIEKEIMDILENYRKDENTPGKIVFQIDDVHFTTPEELDKLKNALKENDKKIINGKLELTNIIGEMTIIFYSRTLDGLGAEGLEAHHNNEHKQKSDQKESGTTEKKKEATILEKIHKKMESFIIKQNQHTLEKITSEYMAAEVIKKEEEMIKLIIEEIFYPHNMMEEMDELTKILTLKSGANPLILELLLEELATTKELIVWNDEVKKWEINRENLNSGRRDQETSEEAYKRGLKEKLEALYPPEDKLDERLLMNKIDQFKGTDAELIMNLAGLLDGVDNEELEAQQLNIKEYPELMGILKLEKENWQNNETKERYTINTYHFKHHLYEEYWERDFEEEIRLLFETWNRERKSLAKIMSAEELEEWIKETEQFFNLKSVKNDALTAIDKELLEEAYNKKTLSNGKKFKDILEKYIYEDFKGKENFKRYMNMRILLKKGFERKENNIQNRIRYGLYWYLAEKESFEVVEGYYNWFANKLTDKIHQYKYNEQFEKDMRFIVEKVLKEMSNEKIDGYWAGLVDSYLADTQMIKGNYDEALSLYSETSERIKNYLNDNENDANAFSLMGTALKSLGNIHAGMGNLQEALVAYKKAIQAHEEAISINMNDGDYHSNKGIALKSLGNIHAGMGNLQEALVAYKKAIQAHEEAISINMNNGDYHSNKGTALVSLGNIHAGMGNLQEALVAYKKAIAAHEEAISINENDGDYHSNKGTALVSLGNIHAGMGNLQEALVAYKKAIAAHEEAISINKNNGGYHSNKGIALVRLGNIHAGMGNLQEALVAYKKAIAAHEEAISINENDGDYHSSKGTALVSLGNIHAGMGNLQEALVAYEKAIEAQEQAISINKNKANYHSNKGIVLYQKGLLLQQTGERQHARDMIERAIQTDQRVLELNPHDPRRYNDLIIDLLKLEELIDTETEKERIRGYYLSVKQGLEAFQRKYPTITEIKEHIDFIEQHLNKEQIQARKEELKVLIQEWIRENSGKKSEQPLFLMSIHGFVLEEQLTAEGLTPETDDTLLKITEKNTTEREGKTINYYTFKDKEHWEIFEQIMLEEIKALSEKHKTKEMAEILDLPEIEKTEYLRYDTFKNLLLKGFETHKGENIEDVIRYGKYLIAVDESVGAVKGEVFQILGSLLQQLKDVVDNDKIIKLVKMIVDEILPEIKTDEAGDILTGLAYYTYGEITYHKSNYVEAEDNHLQSVAELEKIETTDEEAKGYIHNLIQNSYKILGIIYKERGAILHIIDEKEEGRKRFETAKRYAEKAIAIDEQDYSSHLLLGDIYKVEGDYAEKALKLEKYDKAQDAYEKAAEIEENESTMKHLAFIADKKTYVYKEKGENETAKSLFIKAKEYMEKTINFCEDENMIKAYEKGIEGLDEEIQDLDSKKENQDD